jgi:hypothetical protein
MELITTAATTVLPLWQQKRQHDESLRISNTLHKEAIDLNQKFHKEEMEQNEMLFSKDCALERELHYGQMSHDFDIARKEGVRDAWSQQSQLIQTLMIVDTLMFSSAYALLVQGDPPSNSPLWLLRLYAAMLGLSMMLLFSSVWCSLKLQTRLSHYNIHRQDVVYVCGKQHRYFSDYFSCHCKAVARISFVCFYLGTATTLSSAALYAFAKMHYEFSNLAAGIIFVCFSAVAALVPFFTGLVGSWRSHQVVRAGDDQELDEAHARAETAMVEARQAGPATPRSMSGTIVTSMTASDVADRSQNSTPSVRQSTTNIVVGDTSRRDDETWYSCHDDETTDERNTSVS